MRVSITCAMAAGLVVTIMCGSLPAAEDPPSPFTVEKVGTKGENVYVTFLNALLFQRSPQDTGQHCAG